MGCRSLWTWMRPCYSGPMRTIDACCSIDDCESSSLHDITIWQLTWGVLLDNFGELKARRHRVVVVFCLHQEGMCEQLIEGCPLFRLLLQCPRNHVSQLLVLDAAQDLHGPALIDDLAQDLEGMCPWDVRRDHFKQTQTKAENVEFRRLLWIFQ